MDSQDFIQGGEGKLHPPPPKDTQKEKGKKKRGKGEKTIERCFFGATVQVIMQYYLVNNSKLFKRTI